MSRLAIIVVAVVALLAAIPLIIRLARRWQQGTSAYAAGTALPPLYWGETGDGANKDYGRDNSSGESGGTDSGGADSSGDSD